MKPWDLDQRIRPVRPEPLRAYDVRPAPARMDGLVLLQIRTSAGLADLPLDPERALALAEGIRAAVLTATGRGRAQRGREDAQDD